MWLEQRVDDPLLSAIGHQEAEDFANYFAPLFKDSGTEVKVYVSPFHRTLQTAWPLCKVSKVN
jgi:broad specificity phosphatase PhoE